MGEMDYSLKDVISKLDSTVQSLSTAVSDLRVVMASDYQKKADCDTCKSDLHSRINGVIGWIFGCYTLVIAGIGVFVAIK